LGPPESSIWIEDSGGPKEPHIRWGSDPSWSSVCSKWHLNRFIHFCTAQGTASHSIHFTMGHPSPPQNCRFAWWIWTPSNNDFLHL